ncbi:MAG: hypothetical protein ABIE22_00720 [archaeon]
MDGIGFYKVLINPKAEFDQQELWKEGIYTSLREEYDLPVGAIFYFRGLFGKLADTTQRETDPEKIEKRYIEAILEPLREGEKEKRLGPTDFQRCLERLDIRGLTKLLKSEESAFFKPEIKTDLENLASL